MVRFPSLNKNSILHFKPNLMTRLIDVEYFLYIFLGLRKKDYVLSNKGG